METITYRGPLHAAMAPPPPAADPDAKMAPPDTAVPVGVGRDGAARGASADQPLENLRVLRVELQKLQRQLAELRTGSRSVAEIKGPFHKNVEDARALMATVPADAEWGRKIHNAWEDFAASQAVTDIAKLPAERWPRELARLDDLLREMVETIAQRTIPHRMDEWLDRLPHGFYFSFHTAFEDELPRKDARDAMLRDLAGTKRYRAPTEAQRRGRREKGLVDAATGLVYRRWETPWANAAIIAVILGGYALTVLAMRAYGGTVGPAIGIDIDGPALALLYVGILLGTALHMLVGSAKRARAQGAPPNMSPSYISVWFACRFGLWVWTWMLSLFVLAASAKFLGAGGLSFWTAILAGYSLDSIAETFGSALEKRALDHTDRVRARLG